jgi:putative DNA primase/helicase
LYQQEDESASAKGASAKGKTETQRAAVRYMRRGLAVLPVPAGSKNPNRKNWQAERWAEGDIPRLWRNGVNIGVMLGEPSGGLVDVDLDWPEARIAARYILPETLTSGREGCPEGHRWYYADPLPSTKAYKLPGKGDDKCVVELRSTGAQTLVAPSVHPDGGRYVWGRGEIDRTHGERLAERVADIATAALIARSWPGPGSRHDYALAATGYVGRHVPRDRAERVMVGAIAASEDEESRARLGDVKSTLERLANGGSATGGPTLDQLAPGLPDQLARWHGWGSGEGKDPAAKTVNGRPSVDDPPTDDELRDAYLAKNPDVGYGFGVWREYRDGTWPEADDFEVRRGICAVLESAKPDGVRPTRNLLNSVAELTRVRVGVADRVWDSNPDILVCANGALDLATRELLPHAKEHYATAGVPYAYSEDARSLAWECVRSEILKAHLGEAGERFVQEFAGYALTTDTSHEIAVWFTGPKGGGRSTILAGLAAMLGPKAGVLSLRDIERSNFALTNLPGKTLVTATEQPAVYLRGGGTLNAIISGEPIQVDRKYQDPIEVTPRCKIAWAMNELPRIGNVDDGIFRRVKILELPSIPEEHRDPQVKADVQASGAAILNWALEGLDRLRERGGFEVPGKIQSATEDFKEHNDVPAMFVESECVVDPLYWEGGGRLYEAYKDWCLDNGHKPLASNNAAVEWRRLGYKKSRGKRGVRWDGLRLSNQARSDYPNTPGGTP